MKKFMELNSLIRLGVTIYIVLFVVVVVGIFWTPYNPTAMSPTEKFMAPSIKHFMGTDSFGRDIFSRVVKGLSTTVVIALATVVISFVCGTIIGAVTGYFGGIVDDVLMRVGDILTAFPSILLALLIVGFAGGGKMSNVILALGIVFIPSYARMTRSVFASIRKEIYVQGASLMGASNFRILFVHILPNALHVIVPSLTIGFNNAVLAEASMSYLGIGVAPPNASLGYMISEAQGLIAVAPWYALCTGFTLVFVVFGAGLIGEGFKRDTEEF